MTTQPLGTQHWKALNVYQIHYLLSALSQEWVRSRQEGYEGWAWEKEVLQAPCVWKAVVVLAQCSCTISCSHTFCSSLLPGPWGGLQSSLQAPPLALASSGQNRSGRCLFQTTAHSLSLLYLSWQYVLRRHHKMAEAGKAKPPHGGQLS